MESSSKHYCSAAAYQFLKLAHVFGFVQISTHKWVHLLIQFNILCLLFCCQKNKKSRNKIYLKYIYKLVAASDLVQGLSNPFDNFDIHILSVLLYYLLRGSEFSIIYFCEIFHSHSSAIYLLT